MPSGYAGHWPALRALGAKVFKGAAVCSVQPSPSQYLMCPGTLGSAYQPGTISAVPIVTPNVVSQSAVLALADAEAIGEASAIATILVNRRH